MKLSIVTINYNNAEGLRRTLNSVTAQTYHDIEHIIIDGGSTDGSVDVIKEYVRNVERMNDEIIVRDEARKERMNVIWSSEPDHGIYNAMNKGVEIALGKRVVDTFNRSTLCGDKNKGIEIVQGKRIVNADHTTSSNSLNDNRSTLNESQSDYIQILNSGDILASPDVTERMMNALHSFIRSTLNDKIDVPILYGNMIKKDYITGKILGKSREVEYSLRQYFSSTMNHDCCYFRRDLFETYGLYDENLKIVSDWKWFLQAIGLGYVKPVYVDIDVTIFDASGISETNLALRNQECRQVLEELLPPAILADYDMFSFPITQYQRLKKYHLWGLVYFMERVLFKFEKWGVLR